MIFYDLIFSFQCVLEIIFHHMESVVPILRKRLLFLF